VDITGDVCSHFQLNGAIVADCR